MIRRPPRSTLFPTRRSSDLNCARAADGPHIVGQIFDGHIRVGHRLVVFAGTDGAELGEKRQHVVPPAFAQDRKSTRLNSSHVEISYAVFCLKKKRQKSRTPF